MSNDTIRSITNQAVEILRNGMLQGRWKDTLPGRERLAEELGISHQTIEGAMRRLAKEGLLISQGPGKRRRIVLPEGGKTRRHLHVRILVYESVDRGAPDIIDLLERINKLGFTAGIAPKSLLELGMDVKRVARMVQQNQADAWIVVAGSRQVLEWFDAQGLPVYGYFGIKSELPIAGCGVRRDIQPYIRKLVGLGHRRIVMLLREENLKPKPALLAQQFLEALASEGITPSSYHLPEWGFQPEKLRERLDSLFKISPPTALIAGEDCILTAVRDHLSRRGIIAPRDVSLICLGQNPHFSWCDPLVAHFVWDFKSLNRSVERWVKNLAIGKEDRHQKFITAEFIEGGSIGPAPKVTSAGR